jgi:uracil-DNA glycosylase family 4
MESIDRYLKNLRRFYGESLYVESGIEEQSYEQPVSLTDGNVRDEMIKSIIYGRKPPEEDKDLFGNIINVREQWESSDNLNELNSVICECQKCPLGRTRNKFVFGVGDSNADIMLIGEAPGADEDVQGEPFVGRAGQLLNRILAALDFRREEVYICNILKCRPPGNRNPIPDEIEKCLPYLNHQIKLIQPRIILLLGRVAAEALLKNKQPLNKLRGRIHYYSGIKTMVTFHPAALLRNPQWKRPAWEDFQEMKKIYEEQQK